MLGICKFLFYEFSENVILPNYVLSRQIANIFPILVKLNFKRGEVTSPDIGTATEETECGYSWGVSSIPRVTLELRWEKVPRPLRERQSEFFGSGLDLPRSRFSAGVWRNRLHCPCRKRVRGVSGRRNRRKSRFVRPSREIHLNDK